ncbi:MtnX-like HAD-IB family phosphatase [Oryzifoliimicrobium ureilyticus]|uniref:MtnX-like HAD-IB family phosphatase n=1 Tax=Oryzifoliimicrobium ureilyticus TaxID=3113724 RepID=UPI00307638D4
MQAFCDFDGTISKRDVTDLVLGRFASPEWTKVEDLWVDGKITAGECMQRQIAMLDVSLEALGAFLDTVEIDPKFDAFKRLCDDAGISITIVSDGVDFFIERILAGHGITDIPVIANKLVVHSEPSGRTRFSLELPYADSACLAGSGVCKCRVVRSAADAAETKIYVGDGRSDFCVSNEPMFVYAKASLSEHCRENGIPFIAFKDFGDVTRSLQAFLNNAARPLSMPVLSNSAS